MFSNYIKVALRNIQRYKSYSVINITGLAVGMACCILIMLWVKDELSYDRFHENRDRLFRVSKEYVDEPDEKAALTPMPLGPELKERYTEIVRATRLSIEGPKLIRYGDIKFQNEFIAMADPDFLKMFSFPLIRGNANTALSNVSSVVISEKMSHRYFGDADPIGKIVNIDRKDFNVTGVMADIPHNSHLQFDCLVSFESIPQYLKDVLNNWKASAYYTYVLLHESAYPDDVQKKIAGLMNEKSQKKSHPIKLGLQPISQIHLHQDVKDYLKGKGNITYIYLFSALIFLVLLIACMNFMNMATARAGTRLKEIGVRRVIGARKLDLVRQFYGESLILSAIAFILAIILAELSLPMFNNWSGKSIELGITQSPIIIIGSVILVVITALVAGSYPSLFLASLKPVQVLKGRITNVKFGAFLRKGLVTFQFALSVFLIITAIIIYSQLGFIETKDLGFNKERMISMQMRGDFAENYEFMRSELIQYPVFVDITGGLPPTESYNPAVSISWEGKIKTDEDDETVWQFNTVADNYIEAFGMDIVAGRSFLGLKQTKDAAGFIINETAARMMGFDSPIGKTISFGSYENDIKPVPHEGAIIGVVKDYHNASLFNQIEPVILMHDPSALFYLSARINENDEKMAINLLKSKWNEYASEYPFEYSFIDEKLDAQYVAERKLGAVFNWSTWMAIFISCLGLYGLTSFAIEQRRKEIAIRKVMGATIPVIIGMTIKEIVLLIFASIIIAWPVAYFTMRNWLQNFAYRTQLGIGTFIMAGAMALFIAMLVVIYNSFRAAMNNPAETLKYE